MEMRPEAASPRGLMSRQCVHSLTVVTVVATIALTATPATTMAAADGPAPRVSLEQQVKKLSKKVKKLSKQVTTLRGQLAAVEAPPGPAGATGATGPVGVAGGALTGDYPTRRSPRAPSPRLRSLKER